MTDLLATILAKALAALVEAAIARLVIAMMRTPRAAAA
ncbi:UNVERIFIED_ORG: hypothetical protein CLV66_13618 [Actinomadura viridilutea]